MRIAVTVGQRPDGEWDCLALPGTPFQSQKDLAKAIKEANGKLGEDEYIKVVVFTGQAKRHKMHPGSEGHGVPLREGIVQIPVGEDKLGSFTQDDLLAIIKKEGLAIKKPNEKDNAKLIEQIRDARKVKNAEAIEAAEVAAEKEEAAGTRATLLAAIAGEGLKVEDPDLEDNDNLMAQVVKAREAKAASSEGQEEEEARKKLLDIIEIEGLEIKKPNLKNNEKLLAQVVKARAKKADGNDGDRK